MSTARFEVPGERTALPLTTLQGASGVTLLAASTTALSADDARSGEPAPVTARAPAVTLASSPAPAVTAPASPSTVSQAAAAVDAGSVDRNCPPRLALRFAPSDTRPSPAAMTALATMARWAVTHPDAVLMIEGHADAEGSDDANLRMSHSRARIVGWILTRDGVPAERLRKRAFGAWQPSGTDEAHDRRVIVRVDGACAGPLVEVEP